MYKTILARWAKGAISGASASMVLVTLNTPKVWGDFGQIITSLGIAFVFGAITGLILAIDKWANWTETPTA